MDLHLRNSFVIKEEQILESNSGQILFLHEQTQAISAITKKKREYMAIDQKRVMYVQEGGSQC